jgi:hypothetical protein
LTELDIAEREGPRKSVMSRWRMGMRKRTMQRKRTMRKIKIWFQVRIWSTV